MAKKSVGISFFERYLTLWVALCMVVGVLIGKYFPSFPAFLSRFEYANVSIPIYWKFTLTERICFRPYF